MTPKQQNRRRAIFKDLTQRTQKLSEILKKPDDSNYESLKEEQAYYARKGNHMMIADSRFSTVWFRILAHIAADQACKKNFRNPYANNKYIGKAEEYLEEWEFYCADLLWIEEIGEKAVQESYEQGKGFPLF